MQKNKILLVCLLSGLLVFSCSKQITENKLNSDDKAEWYLNAFNILQTKYTKIRIAIIYHDKWENADGSWSDLRINSSPEALRAFQEGISSSYFI